MAMLVLAGVVSGAIATSTQGPVKPATTFDPSYTPVEVVTPAPAPAITVSPVYITAKAPRKATKQTAQCGAFDSRPLTQGVGSVRGFCQ